MTIETHTLANDAGDPCSFLSEISYCGVAVNAGSEQRLKSMAWRGLREHMLFKGQDEGRTISLTAWRAWASLTPTPPRGDVYLPLLKEPSCRGVAERFALNSEFATMSEARGGPRRDLFVPRFLEQIYDDFENLIYEGHDIGHYILGEPESLARLTGSLLQFVEEYQPSNMIFFVWQNTVQSEKREKHFVFPVVENIPVKQQAPG